jgi:hypothetical protein
MAIVVLGGVFAVGLVMVHSPLIERLEAAQVRLRSANHRQALTESIVRLQEQSAMYRDRLPKGVDLADWTDYLISGARETQVIVLRLEPREVTRLGPCQMPEWRMELEGDFTRLGQYVRWLEGGPRLVRIDQLVIEAGDKQQLRMMLQLKGLTL